VRCASFQARLFAIFSVLSLFISCLFITLHSLDKVEETRRHVREELHLRTRQLAERIRLPLYAEDRGLLEQLAQEAGRDPVIAGVTILAADGRVLARHPARPASAEKTIAESVAVASLPAGLSGLPEGECVPTLSIGAVRIERGTADLAGAVYRDVALFALLALLSWLAVSWPGFLVLARMTRSFEALVRGVQAMQAGDYSSRIPVVSADEPGRVAQAINGLAETLERRDRENRALNCELLESIDTEVRARQELAGANHSLARENLERLQAEKAARESEQTLRTLMDIMPVGVLLTRRDGSVEYVNQFLVERFGYPREEIPTLTVWFSLVFPDPAYRGRMLEAQRGRLVPGGGSADPGPYDARLTCQGGELRQVLISNRRQGERTIVTVVDLTERTLMQEQLNKVQKLESLGVLAGGIAHNFNNALTGVLGFISLSRGTLAPPHDAQRYLALAEKASLRAAGMAKQLLTFARGGAPVKRSISLKKLLHEVTSLTLNGSRVRCELELAEPLPPVKADEGQLVQALNNIVINAMQAMPEGGVITIRARAARGECPDPGHGEGDGFVSISIADQGRGIAEQDLPRIFDPYFSTKESTGLGLASVHSIVYRHGGHLSVASQPGRGSTFTVCLPASAEPACQPGERAEAAQPLAPAGGVVLVMDDDQTVRELAGKLLGFLGYRCEVCADGQTAVARYRARREGTEPFLAVILDLTVPGGMGGVEAAREILSLDPAAKLIVSSGYSYDPVLAEYRSHGFCGAVAKPYRAEELSRELGLLR